MTGSTDSGITVTAPPGVDVQQDVSGHTFTLTFGGLMSVAPPEPVSAAHHLGQGQGTAPLIWKPSQQAAEHTKAATTSMISATHVEETHSAAATNSRPPQLARILQQSKDSDGPETPTSPSARASSMNMR